MKSSTMRAQDWRAVLRLAGECRELGNDPIAWRRHLIEALCELTDADLGASGEMAGCRSLAVRDMGVAHWMREGVADPIAVEAAAAEFRRDPAWTPTILEYLRRNVDDDGSCLARTDVVEHRDWYGSHDYQVVYRPCNLDHVLWCFRNIPGAAGDESSGLIMTSRAGRRDFSPRDRALVREVHAAVAPMIGGPLARFADPSPADLPARARPVLACLLEGDGDKQIAARLGLSVHTVNEYTKAIYRHFGVRSRPELLARWIRRGWTSLSSLPPASA